MGGEQKVLLIRHELASKKTSKNLLTRSYKSVVLPFSQIKETGSPLPGNSFDSIIFTSLVAPRVIGSNTDIVELKKLPIHCVGGATANSAKQNGFENIATISNDAPTLANEINIAGNLLYPCAKIISFDFASYLNPKGIHCAEWPIYDNRLVTPPSHELATVIAEAYIVFLFSRRTSDHFFKVLKSQLGELSFEGFKFIAISQNVADTIPRKLLQNTYIADEKNEKSMIECLEKVIR